MVADARVSLYGAALAPDPDTYSDPLYYGEITHPSGSLVELMARVAIRLGSKHTTQKAVWRLDQTMGGGKSHGLVGLWHLATNFDQFALTNLGTRVLTTTQEITGEPLPALGTPHCVVLDCDNTSPSEDDFGPARTLGERFLWRLFQGDGSLYRNYQAHTSNKAKLVQALREAGTPVLVLMDEIMDYLRVAAAADPSEASKDMAFLRAFLDAVNTAPNCAAVVAMIASEKDNMAMTDFGVRLRAEMEDLLARNAVNTAVTTGGDFAAIIRKRLFRRPPSPQVAEQVADLYLAAGRHWRESVFGKASGAHRNEFRRQVARSYPFHPDLMTLAESEWSTHDGFQKVRSMIGVFALAAYEQARRARGGGWAPLLIDSGDLPLDSAPLRDALINSGLVPDGPTAGHLREVAGADIVDPHNPLRGAAANLDRLRDRTPSWVRHNPHASQRMATALFVRSLAPRRGGVRGATREELLAASFVPEADYGYGDAEVVHSELTGSEDGPASIDYAEGKGGTPRRWFFETRKTLEMLTRAERKFIPDSLRDKAVTERAFSLAGSLSPAPFARVLPIEGAEVPSEGVTLDGCLQVLEEELVDVRGARLAILDSRWFSLYNGDDSASRQSLEAAFGLGPRAVPSEWASSLVFACANTVQRARARALAGEWLACRRVAETPSVRSDPDMAKRAASREREAREHLDKQVRLCYRHIAYLAPEGEYCRKVGFIRILGDDLTALDPAHVWNELHRYQKAFQADEFSPDALLHNLRDRDYGRPLVDIRDLWWSNPHKPLLAGGEAELRQTLFRAVEDGEVRIVGPDGEVHPESAEDIGMGTSEFRLARSLTPDGDVGTPDRSDGVAVDIPPGCSVCGMSRGECACGPVWQANINIVADIDHRERREDLRGLLTYLAGCLESGSIRHITQVVQLTVAGDQDAITELTGKVEGAGATISVRHI